MTHLKPVILFFCATMSGLWAALPPPYPVLRVMFEINEQNKSALVAQLLINEWYTEDYPHLGADELLKCTDIANASWPEMSEMFASNGELDLHKIKEVVRVLKINVRDEWNNFFNNNTQTMLDVVDMLNITKLEFMQYLISPKPDDSSIFFDLLSGANLTTANLLHVENTLQISYESTVDFTKEMVFRHLPNVPMLIFTRLLDSLANEEDTPNHGSLLSATFNGLQVQPVGILADIVAEYNRSLPYSPLLATRVSQGHYVTSATGYSQILYMIRQYTQPMLMDVQGHKFDIISMEQNGSLVMIETLDSVSFTAPLNNVTQLENCLYTISDTETIFVSPSQRPTMLVALKSPKVPFINGAPLFCDDQLVGVANEETLTTIGFVRTPYNLSIVLENVPQQNLDFLTYVSFNLIQKRIPELVAYVAMNGSEHLETLSSEDFINAFKFSSATYEQLKFIMEHKFNGNDHLHFIETMREVNASFIGVYNILRMVASQEEEKQILRVLNLDQVKLYNHLVSKNETALGHFLLKGNWTQDNIETVLDIGEDPTAMFELIKQMYLPLLARQPISAVVNLMRESGGYPMMQRLISALNVERNDMRMPGIERIILGFNEDMNSIDIVASAVTSDHLITVNSICDHWKNNMTRYFTQLQVENYGFSPINVSNLVVFSTGYANLTLAEPLPSNIGTIRIGNESMPTNCSAVSDVGALSVTKLEKIEKGFQATMSQDSENINLGAALVCNNALYGVASKIEQNQIQFAGFQNARVVEISSISAHGSSTRMLSYQPLAIVAWCVLIAGLIC